MHNLFQKLIFSLFVLSLTSCSYKSIEVDLIVHNATVYTADDQFSKAEAFAVKDGKIIELGAERAIMNKYDAPEVLDAKKQFIYPGFIDGHCHFLYYGKGLTNVDLVGTKSWNEVLEKVKRFSENSDSEIILGRGWDQNDWEVEEFPNNEKLNELFPSIPVILSRIDGHALIANKAALALAEIKAGQEIDGGIFETNEGELTGILIDNAKDYLMSFIPKDEEKELRDALELAQKNCFQVGLTTVDDAGLDKNEIRLIDEMQREGTLKMRIYAMISDKKDNLDHYYKNGPFKSDRLNVRSVKVYADGAMGSRGACLLAPYADRHDQWGFLLSDFEHFDSIASFCYENNFQLNTHCIGDSANRYLTDVYGRHLGGTNDKRWRIEHAQIVEASDIKKFAEYSIIPSIQPTHATSDMYWVEERLGETRMNEAYPYQSLLQANGMVALGTDFPVENIDPLLTFYAAVSRKDLEGFPEGAFLPEQKLSRKEALLGMTIWNAIANFEENEKGSLEAGKFADFVILDRDIMTIEENKIAGSKVTATFINGEAVYRK